MTQCLIKSWFFLRIPGLLMALRCSSSDAKVSGYEFANANRIRINFWQYLGRSRSMVAPDTDISKALRRVNESTLVHIQPACRARLRDATTRFSLGTATTPQIRYRLNDDSVPQRAVLRLIT